MDRVAAAPARAEIAEKMRTLVAESLAADADAVRLESRLVPELGANSLDFSSPAVMKEGFLTSETVEKLADWLPAIAMVPDRARITPRELFGLITVETLVLLVERKLASPGHSS